MSDGPTVADVRSALFAAAEGSEEGLLLSAFRAWALDRTQLLPALASAAAEGLGIATTRSSQHVAVLGYANAAHTLTDELRGSRAAGIRWLADRQWHRPLREPTLELDGVAMLGVALAARGSDPSVLEALSRLAVGSAQLPHLSPFNRSLMTAAAFMLEAAGRPDLAIVEPEVRVALADLGILPEDRDGGPAAWQKATRFLPRDHEVASAILTLRAFDAICGRNMPARLGRLEADDVVRVLQGVSRSLHGWTWEDRPRTTTSKAVRWDIEHEYHVQNLLWTILAPLFPDLQAEPYTTPVGPKIPRMDLAVPSLGLVVEVKFVRPGVRFATIVEELAADAALYRADPKWRTLVPFVWDDSGRTEDHAILIDGLRKLDMVHDAIVVPRAGRMERGTPPDATGSERRPSRAAGTGKRRNGTVA